MEGQSSVLDPCRFCGGSSERWEGTSTKRRRKASRTAPVGDDVPADWRNGHPKTGYLKDVPHICSGCNTELRKCARKAERVMTAGKRGRVEGTSQATQRRSACHDLGASDCGGGAQGGGAQETSTEAPGSSEAEKRRTRQKTTPLPPVDEHTAALRSAAEQRVEALRAELYPRGVGQPAHCGPPSITVLTC